MAYTIIYRKVVTQSPNGVILPIIEVGSSNLYDYSNKRVKEWYILSSFVTSKEELTKKFKTLVESSFKEADNDISEENWLKADSKFWLSIKAEWTNWTINSLINMLTTPKHNFDELKDILCLVELENFKTKPCTLEELSEEIAKEGKLKNNVRINVADIENYLERI